MKSVNWIWTNFRKQSTTKILFSDEKMFDIDGVYNSQNDQIWTVNRSALDIQFCIRQKCKFSHKVMVWLGVYSKSVSTWVIFEDGTVDHDWYIEEVLLLALKFGNDAFGTHWIYGAKSHNHAKSQRWCAKHFSCFIDKEHWPLNCPDLDSLDYRIWNELVQQLNWDAVISKITLISELKGAVLKVSLDFVFESCSSWMNRLYRLCQGKRYYLKY